MTVRSFTHAALLLSGVFIMTACNRNDDEPQPGPINPQHQPVKRLVASQNDFQTFNYTEDGKVSSYSAQWQNSPDGGITTINQQLVFESGKLKQSTSNAGNIKYYYQEGKVYRAENFLNNGRKLSDHFFEYSALGKLAEVEEIITDPQEDGAEAVLIKLSYYPSGNLEKMEYWYKETNEDDFALSFTKYFEQYDDKRNPIPDAILDHWIPELELFKNNPRVVRTVDTNDATENLLTITYEYDALGRPVHRDQRISINGVLKPVIRYSYLY